MAGRRLFFDDPLPEDLADFLRRKAFFSFGTKRLESRISPTLSSSHDCPVSFGSDPGRVDGGHLVCSERMCQAAVFHDRGPGDRSVRGVFPATYFAHVAGNEGFDFPLRPPDGNGVFIATTFGEEGSLAENWNTALGDGDLGEPVYSIGDGWVNLALDFQSSWGNVVDVIYRLPEGQFPPFVEVMYAHLGKIDVKQFQIVKSGQQIGTIGNVDGLYKAHLRWEVRDQLGLKLDRAKAITRTDGWNRASLSKRTAHAARDRR